MTPWGKGVLLGAVCGALGAGGLLAQGEELKVTTYYPSPRGVYNELRANELVAKQVTLTDHDTEKHYTLMMKEGKLLIADVESQEAFVMIEFPQERQW